MKSKPALVWDAWNKDHIKKHGVTVAEAEEAYHYEVGRTDSYDGRQMFFGVTKKRRLITVAVSYKKQRRPYPVSARIMSKKERRMYL